MTGYARCYSEAHAAATRNLCRGRDTGLTGPEIPQPEGLSMTPVASCWLRY